MKNGAKLSRNESLQVEEKRGSLPPSYMGEFHKGNYIQAVLSLQRFELQHFAFTKLIN